MAAIFGTGVVVVGLVSTLFTARWRRRGKYLKIMRPLSRDQSIFLCHLAIHSSIDAEMNRRTNFFEEGPVQSDFNEIAAATLYHYLRLNGYSKWRAHTVWRHAVRMFINNHVILTPKAIREAAVQELLISHGIPDLADISETKAARDVFIKLKRVI